MRLRRMGSSSCNVMAASGTDWLPQLLLETRDAQAVWKV